MPHANRNEVGSARDRLSNRSKLLAVVAVAMVASRLGLTADFLLLAQGPLLLWLPGALVLARVDASRRLAARLGAECALSIALVVGLLELLQLLGLGHDAAPPLVALATAAAVLIAPAPPPRRLPPLDRIALPLAIAVAILVGLRGGTVGPGTDAGTHLTIVARTAETGRSLRQSPFLVQPIPWQYADAWHRLLATAIGTPSPGPDDVLALWHMAGAIVAAVGLLGFATFAGTLLGHRAAIAALVAYACALPLAHLAFSSALGKALLWPALALAVAAGTAGAMPLAAATVAIALALVAIHPVESYLVVAALGGFALVRWREGWRAARPAAALAAVVAVLIVPLIVSSQRPLLAQVVADEIIDPSFELRQLASSIYIVEPKYWGIDPARPVVWLALIGLVVVWRRGTGTVRAVVLGLVLVAAIGLLFPPLAYLVVELGLPTFLLSRLSILIPLPLLVGAGLEASGLIHRRLAVAVVAALLVVPAVAELAAPSPRIQTARHPILTPAARAALSGLPHGSVVLTDPWSADFIAGAGGHFAVAGITWHTASTRDQLRTWDFFTSPQQTSADADDLLARRLVDFVMLTDWRGSELDWPGYGSRYRPAAADALMRLNPDRFEPLSPTTSIALWRVVAGASERLRGKDARRPAPRDPAARPLANWGDFELVRLGHQDGVAGATLRAVKPTRAAPLIAFLAIPDGFVERSRIARLRRLLSGKPLGFAEARPPGVIRIDDRFYLGRTFEPGELLEVAAKLDVAAGSHLLVGPADALPAFPRPLGPALDAVFVAPGVSRR